MIRGVEGAGWASISGECWCGKRERGWVEAEGAGDDLTPPHRCRQCSAEHCEHAAIARRCEFGICVREAEIELVLGEELTVKVCGLHVSPVLGWGVAEPVEPRIRYLVDRVADAADDRAA